MVPPVLNKALMEPPLANVSVAADAPATARYVPPPATVPVNRNSPLVAEVTPWSISGEVIVPKPEIIAALRLVNAPLRKMPPFNRIVPLLATAALLAVPKIIWLPPSTTSVPL